jgi:hypothetical protein
VPRKSAPGMIGRAGSNPSFMNFHNQGVQRAKYSGPRGSGFTVEFLGVKSMYAFAAGIEDGAIVVANASIESVVLTVDTLKQKLRTYFDGVFSRSTPTRNDHRRASNALIQSVLYNDAEKGQFTGLIYSKLGRGMGPQSFVDYLLAHLNGATLRPQGEWLRIAEDDRSQFLQARGGYVPTGYDKATKTSVYWRPDKNDPNKLYLLRKDERSGHTELLDVLLKSVTIPPSLSGLQPLLDESEAIFDRNLDQVWARMASEAGVN